MIPQRPDDQDHGTDQTLIRCERCGRYGWHTTDKCPDDDVAAIIERFDAEINRLIDGHKRLAEHYRQIVRGLSVRADLEQATVAELKGLANALLAVVEGIEERRCSG